jgi:hypothetical protein
MQQYDEGISRMHQVNVCYLISEYVCYTKTVTQSFPNGSVGGPDGLRPLHLKDLLITIGAPEHN